MIAYTKYENTAETDKRERVMHIVQLDNGKKVEIMARDPEDAIERVKKLMAAYEDG